MVKSINDNDFGPCPLCHGVKAEILFSIKTPFSLFYLVQCKICDLTRTFPLLNEKSFHAHEISPYYGTDTNKFIPFIQKIRVELMRLRAGYYLSFIRDKVRVPKILDVGCAEGRLLSAFLEYGCQCWGIEHPSYPNKRFLNSNRIIYSQDDLKTIGLPEGSFDMIFLWHVLEHMDDPRLVISQLYKLLAPEGVLIMAVPNFSSIESRKFRQSWFHLDIPWHKYHFNMKSIEYLMTKNHFRILKMSTLCLEQGPYGFLQSILNTMGWPKNELYEALKGNRTYGRTIPIIVQFLIMIGLLIPGIFAHLLTSNRGRGPVLKLILKRNRDVHW